jgi:hypothetical protein
MGWSHLARALGAILLTGAIAGAQSPNILLIVADDLGVDKVGAYDEHPDPGRTPVIDFLAARGMLSPRTSCPWTRSRCPSCCARATAPPPSASGTWPASSRAT